MDILSALGPRFIEVDQRGRDIFEGRQWVNPYGQTGAKIFDSRIGTISSLPFGNDSTVRDIKGSKLGVIEALPGGRKVLRRW